MLKPPIPLLPMAERAEGTVRRIYANLIRLLGGKAAAGVISLIYMALATRALGVRDYGVLVLVHGFATTVGGIIEFPGWHAIVRYGAEARAAGDMRRLSRLLRFAATVEAVGGVCAVAVAAIAGPLLGARLGWTPTAIAFAVPYSFAVLASIRATPAGLLQLMGRFDLIGCHNVVAPAVRLIGAVIVTLAEGGLRAFLIAWLVAALAEWVVMWAFGFLVARQTLTTGWIRGGLAGVRQENRGIWRFMLAANADVTLGELPARLVPQVIGSVLGAVPAGLYAIAQRAMTVIAQPAQILGQAAYAELARLVADGASGEALRLAVLRCLTAALLAAVPIVIGMTLFGRAIVIAMGGPSFAGAASVLIWLAFARTILLIGPPVSAALTALGRPTLSVVSNLTANLGLLPFLPMLLSQYGLVGSGWFALGQAIVTASLLLLCFWRESIGSPIIGRALPA